MPQIKRVIDIRLGDDDAYEVTDSYGRHTTNFPVDPEMSIQEFLFRRLRLVPGDRVYVQNQEVNILDEENPTARVGKPRPGRKGPRPGRPPKKE